MVSNLVWVLCIHFYIFHASTAFNNRSTQAALVLQISPSPPLFASPSMLCSRTTLVTQAQRIRDHGGHPCEVTAVLKPVRPFSSRVCRAQSGSPFAFLSMPHSCAALATRERRFTELGGHFSNVWCRAEARAIVCAASPTTQRRKMCHSRTSP